MAPHYRRQLLKVLQELVIAFDNLPDDVKDNLTTAEEIVANTDYLIRIADVCTKQLAEEMESRRQTKQSESKPPLYYYDRNEVYIGSCQCDHSAEIPWITVSSVKVTFLC